MARKMQEPLECKSIEETGYDFEKVGEPQSVGGGVEEFKDKATSRIFYKKPDKNKEEYQKLHAMFRHGIKGPLTTIFDQETESLLRENFYKIYKVG